MSAYLLLKWLDEYIVGMRKNGQEPPQELFEIRKKLNDLMYFDGHC